MYVARMMHRPATPSHAIKYQAVSGLPRQDDAHQCGVWVCAYAACFVYNCRLPDGVTATDFSNSYMKYIAMTVHTNSLDIASDEVAEVGAVAGPSAEAAGHDEAAQADDMAGEPTAAGAEAGPSAEATGDDKAAQVDDMAVDMMTAAEAEAGPSAEATGGDDAAQVDDMAVQQKLLEVTRLRR
eukprot:jgi/Chrzof1/13479/UNPLg00565.t1